MPSTAERAEFSIADEKKLGLFAAALAAALPDHAFVALHGDLGAGKTTLVKAVAAAAGIDPAEVVSPTFGLIHEHVAARESQALRQARAVHQAQALHLVHADLYRLAGLDELRETGWDDLVAPRPDAAVWVFLEWPERIAGALPAERIDLAIEIVSETGRTLSLTAHGPGHAEAVRALRDAAPLSSSPGPRTP